MKRAEALGLAALKRSPKMPEGPPTLPEPSSRRKFFQQAATASILAPLIATLVNMALAGARGEMTEPSPAREFVRFLPALVCLIGMCLGILALFGVKRYGRKGILIKAVLGILIPTALIAIAIPTALRAKTMAAAIRAKNLDSEVHMFARELNLKLPQQVDDLTSLTSVEVEEGRTLVYVYSVELSKLESIDPSFFDEIKETLSTRYKADPEFDAFRERGITIVWRYQSAEGQILGEVDNL